ncbi:hypothetical protein SLE2022_313030 [Rubroshorea leprosula]
MFSSQISTKAHVFILPACKLLPVAESAIAVKAEKRETAAKQEFCVATVGVYNHMRAIVYNPHNPFSLRPGNTLHAESVPTQKGVLQIDLLPFLDSSKSTHDNFFPSSFYSD